MVKHSASSEFLAGPIYKQMERLENIKADHEQEFEDLKQTGRSSLVRVVNLEKFEDFVSHYKKFLTEAIPPNDLKLLIKKFIHKVEVGVEDVKVHWIVDGEHYDRELALARAGSRSPEGVVLDFKNYLSSQSLTIGAQVEQVGEHPSHASTLLIFEYDCYPEAKILSGAELKALFLKLGSWTAVGSSIGASESFARQNVNKE